MKLLIPQRTAGRDRHGRLRKALVRALATGLAPLVMGLAATAQMKPPVHIKAPAPPTAAAPVPPPSGTGAAGSVEEPLPAGKLDLRVEHSTEVLGGLTHIPEWGIPEGLLRSCQAIVIIPHLQSGAFLFGGRYGRGIMVNRLSPKKWSNPCFVHIAGGSYGLQWGYENVDLIFLIMNKHGVEAVLKHKITLGGDATFAAGPLGRNAEAGVDWRLKADILSYSRCRGLFAGLAIQGARLAVDGDANKDFYKQAEDPMKLLSDAAKPYPLSVQPLIRLLNQFIVVQQFSPSYFKDLEEKNKWPPPKKLPQPKLKL